MKALHLVSFILLVIGGLNWLLTAFGWNVVEAIFQEGTLLTKVIYILVGLAAIYEVATHKKNCRACGKSAMPGSTMM